MTPTELNQRFGIDGSARFDAGQGGLTRLVLTSPQSEAHVYLYGGHVTHWQPRGQTPVLFMSAKSLFTPGKAIRGGVPIIFPWFGARADNPKAPQHGFARSMAWEVESVKKETGGGVTATLLLKSNDATRASWPHDFELRHRITVGSTLSMALVVNNKGASAFTFEEALHTYFTVKDARRIAVLGLDGTTYIDKVDGAKRKTQQGPVTIGGETDRVYLQTKAACVIDDPGAGRKITVDKTGSDATVVWNPWEAKAKGMSDFGADEWPGMVCVETANASEHAVTLGPGASHTMTATVRVE